MTPNVKLVSDLSESLEAMTFAAKICYGKEREDMTETDREALMHKILSAKHFSILEHAHACFYITDVSRNFTHQFVRHRHMSFAQQSFHYTVATDQRVPSMPKVSVEAMDILETAFDDAFYAYQELIGMGVPKEDARHILPSGIMTKIVATASIREWMQFVQIRSCAVNCYEIREVARQVSELLQEQLHFMRPYLGPTCFTERTCNEGKKHCGNPWKVLK